MGAPRLPGSDVPSPQVHPNAIHICAVTVEYETKTGRLNKGVATNWLKSKVPNENGSNSLVPMYVRKSQFRLPFKPSTPVIMIGPGTGIAPFIGFIQERAWLKQQGERPETSPGRSCCRALLCGAGQRLQPVLATRGWVRDVGRAKQGPWSWVRSCRVLYRSTRTL